jgi:Cdc6-like AAA superfamily ATPase
MFDNRRLLLPICYVYAIYYQGAIPPYPRVGHYVEHARSCVSMRPHAHTGCNPGVLYICGVPGTGKTSTVKEVLAKEQPSAQQHGLNVIYINAMTLSSPCHVYSQLLEQLTGQRMKPDNASRTLTELWSSGNSSRPKTLLVVDELDEVITKDQAVSFCCLVALVGISATNRGNHSLTAALSRC